MHPLREWRGFIFRIFGLRGVGRLRCSLLDDSAEIVLFLIVFAPSLLLVRLFMFVFLFLWLTPSTVMV